MLDPNKISPQRFLFRDAKSEPTGTIKMIEAIHWRFFVTILLPHDGPMSDRRAKAIWGSFRGRLAKELGVSQKRLLSVVALEYGPGGSNPHLHALISGQMGPAQPAIIMEVMRAIGAPMGLPDVLPSEYERHRSAASYICKELNRPFARGNSASGYWPIASDSVFKALKRHPNRR